MRKTVYTLFMLMLMVLGSFFFAFKHAAAQTGTTVFFSPDPATLYLNGTNSQVVDLMIADAVDLNSFDIILDYDASVATVQSWVHGGFFENLMCIRQENTPGHLWIACVQTASTPKSGPGSVLKLTFRGTGAGTTPITFTQARFSNKDSQPVWPGTTNGTLNVTYNSTIKPTTLSGNISLQGQSLRGGIPVSLEKGLYVGYGPYNTISLPQPDNNYFFTSIVMDAYRIGTAFPYYLNLDASSNKVKGVVGEADTLPLLVLLAGNVSSADNEINIGDLDLIRDNFDLNTRRFQSSAKLSGDANGDGMVDIRDLALAGGNFGLNGATAYLDWMP